MIPSSGILVASRSVSGVVFAALADAADVERRGRSRV
jgi:hypothetical protein